MLARQVESVYTTRGLTKVYGEGLAAVHALRGVDLEITEGELVVLLGALGQRQVDLAQYPGRAGPAFGAVRRYFRTRI